MNLFLNRAVYVMWSNLQAEDDQEDVRRARNQKQKRIRICYEKTLLQNNFQLTYVTKKC